MSTKRTGGEHGVMRVLIQQAQISPQLSQSKAEDICTRFLSRRGKKHKSRQKAEHIAVVSLVAQLLEGQ
jgi:hypothetical protein